MKKIAVIGAGNMGSAIIASLQNSDYQIVCTAAHQASLDKIKENYPTVSVTLSNTEAVKDAHIVFLCVKPYILPKVAEEIQPLIDSKVIVVSVVAGTSLWDLGLLLEDSDHTAYQPLKLFRVIPNTAIQYGKSVTFIAYDTDSTEEDVKEVTSIMDRSGQTFIIDEDKMEICTALGSCGIAYFLRFIRALTEGAVQLGLKPDFATRIAALTAEGAAALMADGAHPEVEIDKVTTPGGLTIKGLNALEENGFTKAAIAALKASV